MVYLILIRHGQSIWNLENKFTGWIDINLSKKGEEEAVLAGKKLKIKKINFDFAYSSKLIRAQRTLFLILDQFEGYRKFQIVHSNWEKSWYSHSKDDSNNLLKIKFDEALNERYYGDLQGLNKDYARERWGEKQVHIWRRSYDIAPPNGESLKDTFYRTIPYFKTEIIPKLFDKKNVLIAAHGNSLRSIIKFIENLSDEQIVSVEIPTGTPIIYEIEFDENKNIKILSKQVLD